MPTSTPLRLGHQKIVNKKLLIFPFSALLGLTACGGGGDSGGSTANIEGLSLPDELDVVTVDQSQTANTPGIGFTGSPADSFGPNSDYSTDPQFAHVWDPSLEPLQEIGKILGMIAQTKSEEFVNDGAYIALVDESKEKVGEGEIGTGDQGQSSGRKTELTPWVVQATRTDNKADQITRVWVPWGMDDDAGAAMGGGMDGNPTIFAKAVIDEGVDDDNQYGSFDMNFVMREDDTVTSQAFQKGILRSVDTVAGYMGFGFAMQDTMWDFSSRAEVRVSEDKSTGLGRVLFTEPDWEGGSMDPVSHEFHIAYNSNLFVRKTDGGEPEVFERDSFDRNTWSYNLYYASGDNAGDRVELIGGFPIQKGKKNGWADYWGIWTEDGFDLVDGETVTGFLPGGVEKTYTVMMAPGRLMRTSREEVTLESMDGAQFHYWYWDPETYENSEFLAEYRHGEGVLGTFWAVATWDHEDMNWQGLDTTEDDVQLDLANGEWVSFWSEGLGGNVEYIYGDDAMSIQKHENVSGDNSVFGMGTTFPLYSVVENLAAGITTEQAQNGQVFLDDGNPADLNSPYSYVFKKSDRTLYLDNGTLTAVGLASGATSEGGPYEWGMMSAPLVTDPAEFSALSDPWQAWQLDEYYLYETGPNDWNQYRALALNGTPVTYDPPLSFLYTHTTANDANNSSDHDGETVFIQYAGYGGLWGIPHTEDKETGRWYPAFSIADGAVMGPNGDEYVIKAVDSELFLRPSTATPSATLMDALDLAGSLVPPAFSEWVNPSDQAKPKVTDAPKVVAGEIQ